MPYLLILGFLIFMVFIFRANSRLPKNSEDRSRRNRCRWKKDNFGRRGALNRFVCLECGVDAFLKGDKPPRECKRHAKETVL